MSLGWIIFWKSVIVSIWALIVERWAAYKKTKSPDQVERYEKIEKYAKRTMWTAALVFFIAGWGITYLMITGPDPMDPGPPPPPLAAPLPSQTGATGH